MIVFCTTCKGRASHLARTLPRNLQDNAGFADAKFVVLDYGSQDHLIDFLQEGYGEDIERGRLIVYSYRHAGPFRMAHAKNMAHRLGILEGGDILVNLDADNFTNPGFARYVAGAFEQSERMFLWTRMIKGAYARGVSGRIAVTARAFINAGGYDEKFEVWSPDDKDFNARLARLCYAAVEIPSDYISAIRHNDAVRFREYRHAQQTVSEYEESEVVRCGGSAVVNGGRIGLGMTFRNFGDVPTIIEPVPTRIFGIGLHKTATTSLHHALEILGYDSVHWESARWAKIIWDEMQAGGRSDTLEKHYALSDLPIGLLYRELDAAYPGSKFVLTMRDETSWLRSVRNHWNYDVNKYRKVWDTDPFTHKLHKRLYGVKRFDAELFIARFRRHNAEVREYFLRRPADLLVLDVSCGGGWSDLCRFLGRAVPITPYPKTYITEVQ